jgi:hypothetical protein
MTPLVATAVIVAVIGVVTGVTIRNGVTRRAGTSAEATRKWQRLVSVALLLGAAILLVIACTAEHHRYVHIAVAAAMVVAAVWQLSQIKRETRTP